MKKTLIAITVSAILTSVSVVSGCNTVQGIGKDVSAGGHDIQRAAS